MSTGLLVFLILFLICYLLYTTTFALFFYHNGHLIFNKRQRLIHSVLIWLIPFFWIMIIKVMMKPAAKACFKRQTYQKKEKGLVPKVSTFFHGGMIHGGPTVGYDSGNTGDVDGTTFLGGEGGGGGMGGDGGGGGGGP